MKFVYYGIAAIVAAYPVSYFATVEIGRLPDHENIRYSTAPKYRIGGDRAKWLFRPIHRLDERWIRPVYWHGSDLRPVQDAFGGE